ncbi:MAG TPA: class I SAM-dependent RNA methyltransferase [Candidatus Lachnoclostridium stercorigallinarum]|uniref:Class I SAM-dependent RNA methyltransferase n=1 Tax=Candidatus Lachnoclostridium stercorigallinarum TaxID=2838634 RepID=A0A9D2K5Q4_9FIRM|nr:class I SAM-dependent RNA methyltransferase [Candidatus Lachnoclostridium stercorigallinarum]
MKKGDRVSGIIEKMEFPNKGIMTVDGERIVVKNALPGQMVLAAVTKKRKGRSEGRLLEVLEKSPLETAEHPCPQFGVCGGCLYQTFPYEEQLNIKESQVRELLDSVCSGYEFEGIKASPMAEEYRNKMEFSFGDEEKDGPLCLGMHRRGSFYDVVNADECRIVHGDFRKILTATREYFAELGVPFYKKLRHEGYLRHLLVRRAVKTGEILVALVTTAQTGWAAPGEGEGCGEDELAGKGTLAERRVLEGWKELIQGLPLEGKLAGILHVKNDSLADVVQSDETEVLFGQDFFYEELLGLRFKISPFSFFQTNSLGAEVLYGKVRDYIGDTAGQVVFDLYSGTGTIAQILAPVAEKVVGVEIVEEAVEAARENAARNGLSNCEFIAGDVLKVVGGLKDKPDLIVLDPPRDGVHPKALNQIIDFGVERMVYVSCKPTSLQRDLVTLQERGYRMVKACCVDMFPGTGNCEVVALLTRCSGEEENAEEREDRG